MAEISIGEAIGEGFGLIRRAPLAVLVWGLPNLAFLITYFALVGAMYAPIFAQAMQAAAAGAGATPTPVTPAQLSGIFALQGVSLLLQLVGGVIASVTMCAVWRAVVTPEKKAFAYLRLGIAEILFFCFYFGGTIVFVIAMFIVIAILAVAVAITFAAHAAAIGVIIAIVGGLLAFAASIWVLCRICLVGPMIVSDGRFHLFDAWALTRGRAGTLFLMTLLVFLIVMIVETVFGLVMLVAGFTTLSISAGGIGQLAGVFQHPTPQLLALALPALLVMGLIWIPFAGCMMAVTYAPYARVYRTLAPGSEAAVFA
jgi:hypothetical protein